jgi:hypothetical protein
MSWLPARKKWGRKGGEERREERLVRGADEGR